MLALMRDMVATDCTDGTEEEITHKAQAIFILFEGSLIGMQDFLDIWPVKAVKAQVRRILG